MSDTYFDLLTISWGWGIIIHPQFQLGMGLRCFSECMIKMNEKVMILQQ